MNRENIAKRMALRIVEELVKKPFLTCGIMGGDFGKVMYIYECSRHNPELQVMADNMLEKLLRDYRNHRYIMTYCNGLAGFGIGLQMLETDGFIEGATEHLSEFDEALDNALRIFLMNGNIDFIHGATGVGFYFISRLQCSCDKANESLTRLVEYLFNHAVWGNDDLGQITAKWVFDRQTALKKYNISLSHGMSSVAILLCRILKYAKYFSPDTIDKCRRMLSGIKNYIIGQHIEAGKYGSLFPTFPKECVNEVGKSRLAWCYGDLGIIFALINIGIALDDKETYMLAKEFAIWEAVNRRNVVGNMVYDACICHGASGVAQAFKALKSITGEEMFWNAYKYWLKVTIGMCVELNGNLEFRNYDVSSHKWRIADSLLEGNAGVGMMLLGADSVLNKILLYDL